MKKILLIMCIAFAVGVFYQNDALARRFKGTHTETDPDEGASMGVTVTLTNKKAKAKTYYKQPGEEKTTYKGKTTGRTTKSKMKHKNYWGEEEEEE